MALLVNKRKTYYEVDFGSLPALPSRVHPSIRRGPCMGTMPQADDRRGCRSDGTWCLPGAKLVSGDTLVPSILA